MQNKILIRVLFCSALLFVQYAQAQSAAKGKLFIIGGGDRSPALLKQMLGSSGINHSDHIVILPMSSAEPDSSFYYINEELHPLCNNVIANLNFTKDKLTNSEWIDSLKHARLIFITGGDQVRFMKAVLHTPVYEAIHYAFDHGATIAGTSAGAAVMPAKMITGNGILQDSVYRATFTRLVYGNIEFSEGLGLIDSVLIDQHFIVRSRYNRLLSGLAEFPTYVCIGIDEQTAIIVEGRQILVAGAGQVVVMSDPTRLNKHQETLIKFSAVRFSIYSAGDRFSLKAPPDLKRAKSLN